MSHKIFASCRLTIAQLIFVSILFFMNNSAYCYSEMKNAPDTVTVTEQNNGDTVEIASGTILILKLEAIPGTGYAWHADSAGSKYLIMTEKPIFLPKEVDSTDKAIGAPAYQVFHYRAQKEGAGILELRYMRGWEKDRPPLKTFSITVRIHE